MGNRYHVVADGFSRVVMAEFNDDLPVLTKEQKQSLDDSVAQQTAQARRQNTVFFDGAMVGVSAMFAHGDRLVLHPQAITYAMHRHLLRTDPHAHVQALYVNALVITSDERLVCGINDAVDAAKVDKVSLPAGNVALGPTKEPSPDAALYAELGQELFLIPEVHYSPKDITLGWISGMSQRNSDYHYTLSFVVPTKFSARDLHDHFHSAREAIISIEGGKTEFSNIVAVPNDRVYLAGYIEKHDRKCTAGARAMLEGKTLDVLQEWAQRYHADVEKLRASKTGAHVYLPQPL